MNPGAHPLVSIVTPTLNAAGFLRETLESVLRQNHPRVEYIVVDGGSTDATLPITAEYSERVRIVQLPGSTQSQAIREGFRRASGEYYAFLNADDTLEREAVTRLLQSLRDAPQAPFAYGDALFVDREGREIRPYPTADFDAAALAQSCFICQPATLIRADSYARAGGIQTRYDAAFDYDLWFRLSAFAAPVRVRTLCARARMHAASKSHRLRRTNLKEICGIVRRNRGYVPFTWVHAYAGVLATGQDLFFDPPRGSPRRTLLTLWLGCALNRGQPGRFVREFRREVRRLRNGA